MGQNPIDYLKQVYKDLTDNYDAGRRQDVRWDRPLPPYMQDMGPDLPAVTKPPMYRPQSEVRGGPEFANTVEKLFNDVPDMRGRAPVITNGPNEARFRVMANSGFKPWSYGDTSIMGETTLMGPQYNHVTVSPKMSQDMNRETLAHEMGHVAGVDHGSAIDALEKLSMGGDYRLMEPGLTSYDPQAQWDKLPNIKEGPKRSMPEPLPVAPFQGTHDPSFFDLLERIRQRTGTFPPNAGMPDRMK